MAEAVKASYRQGQTDYHLKPLVLVNERGAPIGRIKDGDSVICCCRRGEREVQLTRAFVDPTFDEFPRKSFEDLTFVMMTLYHETFRDLPVAFGPVKLKDTLGEVVSQQGLKQLRIAESEKFAHVTFFFNGGNSSPFPGEVDVEVPSPKGLSFEQVPELSLAKVTAEAVKGIAENEYHLIVVNLANGDVIGHTHHKEANLACAEAVDQRLGALLQAAAGNGYVAVVTADHGVLEEMVRPDGSPAVGHTDNPVPFVLIDPELGEESAVTLRKGGKSGDVAPTVLQIMGLPQSEAMTCQSLLENYPCGCQRRVVLVILDGWGIGRQDETNPIFLADTPVWDKITGKYPFTMLKASGEAVGLRKGKKGNSQAGHMNMAAGRLVPQDDVRIDTALKEGSFYRNEAFLEAIDKAKEKKTALHLLGLLSKKSSHGSVDYPLALLRLAKERGLREVYIHIIFDGRSTDPGSAPQLLEEFGREMEAIAIGQIVSGMGRGIALDRDKNYRQKTKLAYDALVFGKGKTVCAYPIAR
jgi:2,3-bisphosphoglycerate-independent phosphoglycerate mutase